MSQNSERVKGIASEQTAGNARRRDYLQDGNEGWTRMEPAEVVGGNATSGYDCRVKLPDQSLDATVWEGVYATPDPTATYTTGDNVMLVWRGSNDGPPRILRSSTGAGDSTTVTRFIASPWLDFFSAT